MQRQIVPLDGVESPWLPLDIVAEKSFHDDDVPEGLREARYRVRAMRANGKRSDWSCANAVRFGTIPSAGDARADLEAKPQPKPAATATP